jgi:hypothetical protein
MNDQFVHTWRLHEYLSSLGISSLSSTSLACSHSGSTAGSKKWAIYSTQRFNRIRGSNKIVKNRLSIKITK